MMSCFCFFFFQAEDGIRDLTVTGVQTCALPISFPRPAAVWPPCRVPTRRERLPRPADGRRDRKSTRLNSSHSQISYAVFCLKKKINPHGCSVSIFPHTSDDRPRSCL